MNNYTSPYGFGPLTDMILDAVADRHEVRVDEVEQRLENEDPEGYGTIREWIENHAWDNVIGPVVDAFDDRLFPEEVQA